MASILVIGPHPDDQELAMGGTIAMLAAQGHRVTLVDMTDGEPTPTGERATRLVESHAAARALSPEGGRPIERVLLDLPNRRVEHTLAARHAVAGVIRAVQATVLFVPYFEDAHPDHLAVTRIAEDARFDAKLTKVSMPGDGGQGPIYPAWLIYYYATHLRIVPQPSFVMDISAFAGQKRQAIEAYASQFARNPKNVGVPDRIATQDAYFGSRINTAAGEPFFTREPLGLGSLASIVNLG
ncbi:MAG: PIG-L family deacetylase [Phycisphaerales bacterium]|jgi:bacillithiol biosynthesis deacetylase BshB1|nr:PIG-L family deacetylase [Phycisphaerales bacterium]